MSKFPQKNEARNSNQEIKSRSLMDVCRNDLIRSIECNVPCSDGYGPKNLISTNFFERNKGFLAEGFVKPPVHLTLELKSEIDVEYIAITCSVGAQKSKGLEILTRSNVRGNLFESVASGILPDDKNGFVFHRFNLPSSVKDKFGEQYYYRTFKSSRFLSAVTVIEIKIFRTCGSCVSALGKVEIWGAPIKSASFGLEVNTASQAQICEVKNTRNLNLPSVGLSFHSSEPSTSQSLPLPLETTRPEKDKKCAVPEDFIDPITCEFMIQPIILPSGKVVDNSTLKAYEQAELKWGRGPSDPFTGIPFSESHKPIAASDLKCRIDKFLTDNCNFSELKNIPRTLGRNSHQVSKLINSDVSISKLVVNASSNSKIKNLDLPNKSCTYKTDTNESSTGKTLKRKHIKIDLDGKSNSKFIDDSTKRSVTSSPSSMNVDKEEAHCSNKLSYPPECIKTFEERMEQSLEQALQSTLSKLPKFTSDEVDSMDINIVVCYSCKSVENLFSIPCNHYVCRLCLLRIRNDEIPALCIMCNISFKLSDVQKVHTGCS